MEHLSRRLHFDIVYHVTATSLTYISILRTYSVSHRPNIYTEIVQNWSILYGDLCTVTNLYFLVKTSILCITTIYEQYYYIGTIIIDVEHSFNILNYLYGHVHVIEKHYMQYYFAMCLAPILLMNYVISEEMSKQGN